MVALSAETISQLRAVAANMAGSLAVTSRPQTTTMFVDNTAEIEAEVIQLRSALSERTLQAQRLTQELDRANRMVDELRELCHEHQTSSVPQQALVPSSNGEANGTVYG